MWYNDAQDGKAVIDPRREEQSGSVLDGPGRSFLFCRPRLRAHLLTTRKRAVVLPVAAVRWAKILKCGQLDLRIPCRTRAM